MYTSKKVQLLGRSASNQSSKNKMVCFRKADLLLLPYFPLGTLVQQLACHGDGITGAQHRQHRGAEESCSRGWSWPLSYIFLYFPSLFPGVVLGLDVE